MCHPMASKLTHLRLLLRALAASSATENPSRLGFLRVASGDCRRCLKSCVGGKIQDLQVKAMKIQAPLSLVTMYLFKNRPFTMYPLDKALTALLRIPPAVPAAAIALTYLSCKTSCDMDCP